MWDEMRFTQDIEFDKETLQFKGFVYIEDDSLQELSEKEENNENTHLMPKNPKPKSHCLLIMPLF